MAAPSDTAGYQYYLLCSLLSILIAGSVVWASRRFTRQEEPRRVLRQPALMQPRPSFSDAYLAHETPREKGKEWEWEEIMPLSVSAIGASASSHWGLTDDPIQNEASLPLRAEVVVLIRMPDSGDKQLNDGDDLPYLDIGTCELDL
ncbi:hypothetical protein DFH07DRAFT_6173 [Mycena maculata]|uniref:Uncharacterized protein n=1 Tax=Mycena maculata TaxID=230809 RepID=A0AAD7KKE3_9AGAR|nr:hypothetical protein DFH07DRAFT_6173 [Mycena maculata]